MNGNQLEERLIRSLETGHPAHAYVLEGPKSVTTGIADRFAAALLCTGEGKKPCGSCPSCRNLRNGITEDRIVLEAESSGKSGNRMLKDYQVEEMQDALQKKPLAGERIVAVIRDADYLNERAQNRLLKTLEEPPGRDAIILLSENTEHLLATILSRCQVLKVSGGEDEETAEDSVFREYAKTFRKLALESRPYYAFLEVLEAVTETKPQADLFLDKLEELLSETLVRKAEKGGTIGEEEAIWYRNAVYSAEEARKDLARNVNVGYALKDMTLKILENIND